MTDTDHYWVKIVITPIHVVDDPDASLEPVIFIGNVDEEEAKECAQYGCLRCDEVLTADALKTLCLPDLDQELESINSEDTSPEKP